MKVKSESEVAQSYFNFKKKKIRLPKGLAVPEGLAACISSVALCPQFLSFLMNINIESQSDGSLNALVPPSSSNPNS